MSAGAIMVNGALVGHGEALIPLDDGLVRGDGVFEGMRAYGRRARTPQQHLDRLARSAANVDLPVDLEQLREELDRFLSATASPDCAVRLMVTRSGHRIWREEPLPAPSPGLRLLPVPHRVTPLLVAAKTLSYAANMEAQRRARAAGCDDALLVTADDDLILEGPTTSFCWIDGDGVVFPPLDLGILDSITRRLAVAATGAREERATLNRLSSAQGALLLSTVQEALPVAEVAGVASFDPAAAAVIAARDAVRGAILEAIGRD